MGRKGVKLAVGLILGKMPLIGWIVTTASHATKTVAKTRGIAGKFVKGVVGLVDMPRI